MMADPRQGYLLWGIEPDRDLPDPTTAMAGLRQARQVVACSAFASPALQAVADVLLPISAYAETAGTFVNAECRWQRFQGAVAPPGDARPGWKVLRVLGTMMELDGFAQNSAREVHDELAARCEGLKPDNRLGVADSAAAPTTTDPAPESPLIRVGNLPIYASDALVRRADSLQRTPLAEALAIHLHPDQGAALGLSDGDLASVMQTALNGDSVQVSAPVVFDDRVAPGCARIPAAVDGSEALGPAIGPVTIARSSGEETMT
jgi:NADH-quinone oxidoreductase subunit G